MARLNDVGPAPNQPADLVPRSYLDALVTANLTQSAVNSLISSGLATYATKAYVDGRDALNATKAYIDNGDAIRLHLADVGTPNGVCGLDNTGRVESARIQVASDQQFPAPFYSPSSYGSTVSTVGTEVTVYSTTIPSQGGSYTIQSIFGSLDTTTSVDGVYPIVRVRAISTSGPVVAIGQGSSEHYIIGAVAYDATGSGVVVHSSAMSWSHTAAAGSYVVVALSTDNNFYASSVSYGGQAMTGLTYKYFANSAQYGWVEMFGLANAPGGSQTVSVTLSGTCYAVGQSVSYTGVLSATAGPSSSGSGTGSLSLAATCATGQMIVQAFGASSYFGANSALSASGGTNRSNLYNSGNYNNPAMTISDSSVSTTFRATDSNASNTYAGVSVVLNINPPPGGDFNTHSVMTIVPTSGSNLVLSGATPLYVTLAGSGSSATVTASTAVRSLWVTPIAAPPFNPITEENTNRSSYPVPAGSAGAYVTLIGAGGAGGNGTTTGTSSTAGASGGGGGGRINRTWVPRYLMGDTYSVSRGVGGAAAQQAGGASTFSTGSISLVGGGGRGGVTPASRASSTAGGAGGVATASGISASGSNGTAGGSGTNSRNGPVGGAGGSNTTNDVGCGGGAGGGTYTGLPGWANGGAGGSCNSHTGGVGGTSGTPSPAAPSDSTATHGGAGGGGGAGNYNTQPGGSGSHGALYGGGGGGGGTGSTAGSFGAGASGYTLVEWA